MGIRIPTFSSPVAADSAGEAGPASPHRISVRQARLLHHCAHCNRRIFFGGYADGATRYCSISCFTAGSFQGFCHVCMTTTTDEDPGETSLHNGIGTILRPREQRCSMCHSVLTRKWFVVFLIPVIPLTEYRVRWINHRTYIGRRVNIS